MDDAHDRFAPGVLLNNRYQLQRELGRGGMGAVFAARDTLLDAPVAIKVLLGERPSTMLARRFLQEARAAAQVRHANIVSVLDIGQDESTGALFLVQEFLPGVDLKRHVQSVGPLSPRQAIELLLPVMRGLAFAHSKGVVHRDLKPDNIFLCDTNDGVVPKIIDFGIAKVIDEQGQSAQHTRTSQVLGTPYYMSPEQARGDRAVDQRSDIWSLGVVLFFALTKRYPHEGTTTNLIITNIIARQPTSIAAYAPTLPSPVVELVHRALQYKPEQRHPSMDAFSHAARSCLTALGAPVEAPPQTRISTSGPFAPSIPSTEMYTVAPQVMATEPEGTSRSSNARLWMALAAVLLLASCAGLAGYLSTRTAPPTTTPPRPATSHALVQAPVAPVAAVIASPQGASPPVVHPQPEAAPQPPRTEPPPAPPAVVARVTPPPTQRSRQRLRTDPQPPREGPSRTVVAPAASPNPFY